MCCRCAQLWFKTRLAPPHVLSWLTLCACLALVPDAMRDVRRCCNALPHALKSRGADRCWVRTRPGVALPRANSPDHCFSHRCVRRWRKAVAGRGRGMTRHCCRAALMGRRSQERLPQIGPSVRARKTGSDLPNRELGRRIAHARIRVQFVKTTRGYT